MKDKDLLPALISLFTAYCILIIAVITGIGTIILQKDFWLNNYSIISLTLLTGIGIFVMNHLVKTHSKIIKIINS